MSTVNSAPWARNPCGHILPPALDVLRQPAERLTETLEPMILRELYHRGFMGEQRGYDAKLIGWVEVVDNHYS